MRLSDLRVSVSESLFELSLRLDPGVFHVFEVLAHILHLVLQIGQVGVITGLSLNHGGFLKGLLRLICFLN